jgi:hypothetical protein
MAGVVGWLLVVEGWCWKSWWVLEVLGRTGEEKYIKVDTRGVRQHESYKSMPMTTMLQEESPSWEKTVDQDVQDLNGRS